MGRDPKDINVYLNDDLILIRLRGVLSAVTAGGQIASGGEGAGFGQANAVSLLETTRPVLEAMVEKVTGVKVLSLHHDISTVTGEGSSYSPSPSR